MYVNVDANVKIKHVVIQYLYSSTSTKYFEIHLCCITQVLHEYNTSITQRPHGPIGGGGAEPFHGTLLAPSIERFKPSPDQRLRWRWRLLCEKVGGFL